MTVSQAIQAMRSALTTAEFIERGSTKHAELNSSYLAGQESDLSPAWIVRPRSREHVASFLRAIKPFVDTVKFAVRGAGNQPVAACANIQDGITLDLGLLTGIEVKEGLVQIGAGERWGKVYEVLGAKGLGVAGGRSSRNGIGGLSLQGGLSFVSSREGFICDNIVNLEVVLASGSIVEANVDENPDLFAALKGAGNNLGIVTRYDLRTFEQGPVYGGTVFYFAHSFPAQVDALVNELCKPNPSKETHLMLSLGFSGMMSKDAMCLNQPYYTRAVENPPELEPFTKIQPQIDHMNTMRLQTLKEASEEQAASAQHQVRCSYMNITVKADAATLQAAADIYTAALDPVKGVENATLSFTLQPYPVSLLDKASEGAGNSLGLSPSNGPLVSILLLSYWKNKTDDDVIENFMENTLDKIRQDAEKRKQLVPFVYMNYAGRHQDPLASYGSANKKKLQHASNKYDPDGIFQTGCPGGFKLFP